jgi:hypothetical protein
MKIIGIDPGKNGGITSLEDNEIHQYTIPKIKGSTKVDYRKLDGIIAQWRGCDTHVFIEEVHALYGSSAGATFSFGYICGVTMGMIVSAKVPFTLVQPKVWQKVMFKGIPDIRKPYKDGKKGKTDTKAMALIAAKRLFPGMDFLATQRSKNPHDGLVDSIIIAEYGRRLT